MKPGKLTAQLSWSSDYIGPDVSQLLNLWGRPQSFCCAVIILQLSLNRFAASVLACLFSHCLCSHMLSPPVCYLSISLGWSQVCACYFCSTLSGCACARPRSCLHCLNCSLTSGHTFHLQFVNTMLVLPYLKSSTALPSLPVITTYALLCFSFQTCNFLILLFTCFFVLLFLFPPVLAPFVCSCCRLAVL